MRHMSIEEWDRTVAPYLSLIEIRARNIDADAKSILAWIGMLPAAPDFETNAFERLTNARQKLAIAAEVLQKACAMYNEKEKVK